MNSADLLERGFRELEIACSETLIHAFTVYLSELKKWNRAYNLTALMSDEDIIIKHFFDSLLYLSMVPPGVKKVADIGTGAGFPGLPLKIVRPELEMTLVESSRKKAAFLKNIVRCLHITGITILEKRMEQLGEEYYHHFNVVLSRATFSIRDFLKAACPFVKEEGVLVVSKGPKATGELKELERSIPSVGAVRTLQSVRLPLTHVRRNLIVLSCTMEQ